MELANRFKSLTIVHEFSSAVLNCRLGGVVFDEVDVGTSDRDKDERVQRVRRAAEELLSRRTEASVIEDRSLKGSLSF